MLWLGTESENRKPREAERRREYGTRPRTERWRLQLSHGAPGPMSDSLMLGWTVADNYILQWQYVCKTVQNKNRSEETAKSLLQYPLTIDKAHGLFPY